jgi:hypothetical protein
MAVYVNFSPGLKALSGLVLANFHVTSTWKISKVQACSVTSGLPIVMISPRALPSMGSVLFASAAPCSMSYADGTGHHVPFIRAEGVLRT